MYRTSNTGREENVHLSCFHIVLEINKNHIKCWSNDYNINDLESLKNTDSDVNIIKIKYLREDLVEDKTKRILI